MTTPVLFIMIAMIIFVTVLCVITTIFYSKFPKDMATRIRSWFLMQGVLFSSICFNFNILIILVSVLSLVGISELSNSIKISKRRYPKLEKTYGFNIGLLLIIMVLSLYLLNIEHQEHMAGMFLFLLMTTQLSDVAQYACGKKFGKHKLCASISPNKTIEGAVGGVGLIAVLSTLIGPALIQIPTLTCFLLSIVLSVFGILGDLSVSQYKRITGVKDMGSLIPGHGGVLDRMDSLLLSTPIFFMAVDFTL